MQVPRNTYNTNSHRIGPKVNYPDSFHKTHPYSSKIHQTTRYKHGSKAYNMYRIITKQKNIVNKFKTHINQRKICVLYLTKKFCYGKINLITV